MQYPPEQGTIVSPAGKREGELVWVDLGGGTGFNVESMLKKVCAAECLGALNRGLLDLWDLNC